ncbi:MAG: hypothetical protein BWY52_02860 [Chloroflexi bacterium ADurb.Bin325]|nr:MAG: hypothetical protein BWY52_02860 [Chloroflexi bacterium ADurb.Bin325]
MAGDIIDHRGGVWHHDGVQRHAVAAHHQRLESGPRAGALLAAHEHRLAARAVQRGPVERLPAVERPKLEDCQAGERVLGMHDDRHRIAADRHGIQAGRRGRVRGQPCHRGQIHRAAAQLGHPRARSAPAHIHQHVRLAGLVGCRQLVEHGGHGRGAGDAQRGGRGRLAPARGARRKGEQEQDEQAEPRHPRALCGRPRPLLLSEQARTNRRFARSSVQEGGRRAHRRGPQRASASASAATPTTMQYAANTYSLPRRR